MKTGTLGRIYQDGEVIIRQGQPGECMYVIQSGQVEVFAEDRPGQVVRICTLGPGDFFGEMSLLDHLARSATVQAMGEAQVLTLDKKSFLRRVQADPSLAFRLLQVLSSRVRHLDAELVRLKSAATPPSALPFERVRPPTRPAEMW